MLFAVVCQLESMGKQFEHLALRKVATEESEAPIGLDRIHQLRKGRTEGIGTKIREVRLLARGTHQRFLGQRNRNDSQSRQDATKRIERANRERAKRF